MRRTQHQTNSRPTWIQQQTNSRPTCPTRKARDVTGGQNGKTVQPQVEGCRALRGRDVPQLRGVARVAGRQRERSATAHPRPRRRLLGHRAQRHSHAGARRHVGEVCKGKRVAVVELLEPDLLARRGRRPALDPGPRGAWRTGLVDDLALDPERVLVNGDDLIPPRVREHQGRGSIKVGCQRC